MIIRLMICAHMELFCTVYVFFTNHVLDFFRVQYYTKKSIHRQFEFELRFCYEKVYFKLLAYISNIISSFIYLFPVEQLIDPTISPIYYLFYNFRVPQGFLHIRYLIYSQKDRALQKRPSLF